MVDQLRAGGLQTPRREVRQSLGVGFARDQGRQNGAATGAKDVADHFRQLHIGVFEGLLNPLHVASPLAHQLLARAREIAQLLDRSRGDETTPDQSQRQQIGDPRRIVLVAFPTRDVPDVHGVGEDEGHVVLKDVPHRLPVDAGRFHRHMRDALRREPVRELEQSAGIRRDRAVFVRHGPARGNLGVTDTAKIGFSHFAARIGKTI